MAKNATTTETITKADVGTAPAAVIMTPAAATKADKARVIFGEAYSDLAKVPARKDIIARLVAEAGLTPKGAATYLQNYKTKAGLVKKPAPTA